MYSFHFPIRILFEKRTFYKVKRITIPNPGDRYHDDGVYIFYAYPSLDFEWLFGSKPYSQLDINLPFAWIEQLFIYGLSFITVLSFGHSYLNKNISLRKSVNIRCMYIYYTDLLFDIFVSPSLNNGLMTMNGSYYSHLSP